MKKRFLYLFVKRFIDLLVGTILIFVTLPLFFLVFLTVRLKLGSPVLFSQERPGKHEKPFKLYKFRTMNSERDSKGNLLPDEDRLTRLGKLLRKYSLDELPQLLNVLKGDLSLVGPRPLLMIYLPRYNERQKRRHEVKPGITGWAQVNGRNALNWEEKFELDIWYVDNCSFILDLKILCLTFIKVIKSDGVSKEGHATMPEFMGNGKQEVEL